MSPRFLLLLFGVAHSFALLSKNLQSIVNKKLMPSNLVKMKAVDPNWRGEGIFKKLTEVAGLFVHKETNEIILESKEKVWTESEIIEKLKDAYEPDEFKNLIKTRDWNRLFAGYLPEDKFKKYWREALAEIVDVDKFEYGVTLLMESVQRDDNNIVKILLERGADVSAEDSDGWTVLHHAAKAYSRHYAEAIELLLEFNAKIDATDKSEETPLMRAARYSSFDAVKVLLEHGARSDMKNNNGYTALHFAVASWKNTEAIELLLNFKAEIDATDKSEETPLMKAVKCLSVDAVEVLLGRNARLDMKNSDGKTALEIAKCSRPQWGIRNGKIIKLLESQQNQVVVEKQNKRASCEKCLIV